MTLHVLNFEFTDIPEQYIHRIGRTGRADKVVLRKFGQKEEEIQLEAEVLMEKEIPFYQFRKVLKLQFDYWSLKRFQK
jgi:ATP-dependent RNA helicase RhlE